MSRVPARVRLGTANAREMEQLSRFLELLRARERAGHPVPVANHRPVTERFNTRHLIAQLKRTHRRTQATPLMVMLFFTAACLGPVVARAFGWV